MPRFQPPPRPPTSRFRFGEKVVPTNFGERSTEIAPRTGRRQVELPALLRRSGERDVQVRPELEGAVQVRHACARIVVAAARGGRGGHAHVDLDALRVEQQRARAVAVGLEPGAAVDDVGQRQRVEPALVGARVVGQAQAGDAEAEFPQRPLHAGVQAGVDIGAGLDRLIGRKRGGAPCTGQHEHQAANDHAAAPVRAKPCASISTNRSARQMSACR